MSVASGQGGGGGDVEMGAQLLVENSIELSMRAMSPPLNQSYLSPSNDIICP